MGLVSKIQALNGKLIEENNIFDRLTVDKLGRIKLTVELKKILGIEEKDAVEFFVKKKTIILKRCELDCIFCHSTVDIENYRGKIICRNCIGGM